MNATDPSLHEHAFHPSEILPAEWVFAYGSLIWNPEFDHVERTLARVRGYHRAFCIGSTRYRGTPEQPGVVLGLARGGSVTGMAFKLEDATRQESLLRLYVREMSDRVYEPRLLRTRLADGREVQALAFVANTRSPAYLDLPEHEIAHRLCRSVGMRGPNCEYAINTLHALERLGVRDERLARLVRDIESRIDPAFLDTHRRTWP